MVLNHAIMTTTARAPVPEARGPERGREPPLFAGVRQVEARIEGHDFKLPLFYRDASSITAIFPAKLAEARRLLGHPSLQAAPLVPGVGAIGITSFEYRDTDIGPYNELAVTVLATHGSRPLPFVSLVEGLRTHTVHAYVRHLPVTTEIARVGGVEIYGYPKHVTRIDFRARKGRFETSLWDDGVRPIELSGPLPTGGRTGVPLRYVTYTVKAGRPVEAQVLAFADTLAQTWRARATRLRLDPQHPVGAELGRALLTRRPVMLQWVPRFGSILHGPNFLE